MPSTDYSAVIQPVVDTLTDPNVLVPFGILAALGISIGTVVVMAPRLFNFIYRFIPEGGSSDAPAGGYGWHENSDGSWDWDHGSEQF